MEGVDNIEAVEPVLAVDETKDEPAPEVLHVAPEVKDGVDFEQDPQGMRSESSPKPRVGRKLMSARRGGYWRGDLDAEYCRIQCEATARNQRVKFLDTIHDVANEAANLARFGQQYAHDMPECARDDPKYFRDYLLEASGLLAKMAEMELERGEVVEIPEAQHVESL